MERTSRKKLLRLVQPWNAKQLRGRHRRREQEALRLLAAELAQKRGRKPIHIALAYVLAQPFPVIPLIGPRNVAELEDSLSALDIRLTADEVKWLEG